MSFLQITMRLLILVCVMVHGNLCLYAADSGVLIQTEDPNLSPEKSIDPPALTDEEQAVIQRALEMTAAAISRSQPDTTSNLSQAAKTTKDLADSINQQLNSRSPQDRPPQNEVPYEVPLTPSLPELERSTPPDREEASNNKQLNDRPPQNEVPYEEPLTPSLPELQGSTPPDREEEALNLPAPEPEENSELPSHTGITNDDPPFLNDYYSNIPSQSVPIETPEESENLIDFISQGGISLNPAESNDLLKNRSWSEALDLKLLQLENERNETQVKLDDGDQQEEVIVLDAVNFTPQIRAIYQLLNPPARLHPWLKWLLYSSRINPPMLELYYSALRKRDQIYMLTANAKGKLKIRYRGKMVDVPIFVWPEQAQGLYELVMVKGREASEGKLETSTLPRL